MLKRYNQWAGNPKGVEADEIRCVEAVSDEAGWHFRQCSRKRGYGKDGLYCKQHAKRHPMIVVSKVREDKT